MEAAPRQDPEQEQQQGEQITGSQEVGAGKNEIQQQQGSGEVDETEQSDLPKESREGGENEEESTQGGQTESVHPLAALFRRALGPRQQSRASNSSIIHPSAMREAAAEGGGPSIRKAETTASQQQQQPWNLSELDQDAETIRRKQVRSVYVLALVPLGLTAYRIWFANDGPTWFSFHPLMMCVSIGSVLTSVLCQRMGGTDNTRLVGTLSFAAGLALLLGLYAVSSSKEMYAKVHFISMHSHLGGMTFLAVLAYVATAFYVYDPIRGVPRKDETWQRRLITLGKTAVSSAIIGMSLGVWEVERSYILLPLWMATIYLMAPFVILPFFNDEQERGSSGLGAQENGLKDSGAFGRGNNGSQQLQDENFQKSQTTLEVASS